MTDIIIETQNITQNITQATCITYLQTPIITDTRPVPNCRKSSNRSGGWVDEFRLNPYKRQGFRRLNSYNGSGAVMICFNTTILLYF